MQRPVNAHLHDLSKDADNVLLPTTPYPMEEPVLVHGEPFPWDKQYRVNLL